MRIQSAYRPALVDQDADRRTAFDDAPAATPRGQRLGELLVERGVLSHQQAEQVARAQRGSGTRFGDTAVALGFADADAINSAVASQFDFAVIAPGTLQLDPALVVAHGTRDRASELIRGLRAKLWQELQAGTGSAAPMVTVASMTGAVGRRVIAGNLAIAFAQAGVRTLLVDADMRNPALHRLFKMANQTGLSTFLAARQPLPDIAAIDGIPGLSFLPAGPPPPNPAELLGRLAAALPKLAAAADARLVLLSAPPFATADDGYLIAAATTSLVLVTRRHFTRAKPLENVGRRLRAANVRIVGSVLNVA